jgi:hypothetical protein
MLDRFHRRALYVKDEPKIDKHLCPSPCACARANIQLTIFGGHTHVQRVEAESTCASHPKGCQPSTETTSMSTSPETDSSFSFSSKQTSAMMNNPLVLDSPFAFENAMVQASIPNMPDLLFPSPDLQSVDTFPIGQMFSTDDWTSMGSIPMSWNSPDPNQQAIPEVYWPRSDASSAQAGYLDNAAAMDAQWMAFIRDTGILQGGEVNDVGV